MRSLPDIEALKKLCCTEAEGAKQLRIDELSTQENESKSTLNQLLVQIQELQDRVNSLSDSREFYDPETASSSGSPHVPSQPAAILACSLIHGTHLAYQETFLKTYVLHMNHQQLSLEIREVWHQHHVCISTNSVIFLRSSVGKRVSRPRYVPVQAFLWTLCCGSK